MAYWEAVLLGIVQGLTEFLPVSSSGHLVLGKTLLGLPTSSIAFEVFVHFGTLLAIITVLRSEVVILLNGLTSLLLFRFPSKNDNPGTNERKGVRLLALLLTGTVPAAIIGYIFYDKIAAIFSSPTFACFALIGTGLILTASRFAVEQKQSISHRGSLLIGIAQILAILPGISRSGTTITAAILLGIDREEAVRFSFLLAIPLILAATMLQLIELVSNFPGSREIITLVIGTIAAYISGIFAIKWLLSVVQKNRFHRFAYYCFIVGAAGLFFIFAF